MTDVHWSEDIAGVMVNMIDATGAFPNRGGVAVEVPVGDRWVRTAERYTLGDDASREKALLNIRAWAAEVIAK